MDTYFSGLKAYFPERNYKVNSVCSQEGTSQQALQDLAANFVTIVNSEYTLGLLPNEMIESIQLLKSGSNELITLRVNEHYKIQNDQFILLDIALKDFQRIEVKIKMK